MNIEYFVDKICIQNELDVDRLKGKCRKIEYMDCRRILYAFLFENNIKMTEIAKYFNRTNHTSISIAYKKHKWYLSNDKKYKEKYQYFINN